MGCRGAVASDPERFDASPASGQGTHADEQQEYLASREIAGDGSDFEQESARLEPTIASVHCRFSPKSLPASPRGSSRIARDTSMWSVRDELFAAATALLALATGASGATANPWPSLLGSRDAFPP